MFEQSCATREWQKERREQGISEFFVAALSV
jgi:hypothetical protein